MTEEWFKKYLEEENNWKARINKLNSQVILLMEENRKCMTCEYKYLIVNGLPLYIPCIFMNSG
jgi:hypothetical protein